MNALKAEVEALALIRRAQVAGAFAAVVHRGDRDAGSLLVKVTTLDGKATLYTPMTSGFDDDARRIWLAAPGEERAIDERLRRRLDDDPDAWAVEIEDREGRHFLVDPVEGG
jgi:hypothetical protein